MDVLFLCTGNICRSPAAEALLRHRLAEAGIPVHVHSAGLLEAGNRAHFHGVDVLSARGIDLSSHRSRSMTAELLGDADLVVAMERAHVREAVVLVRDAWPKTFTLKELVRRGRQAGPRRPGEPLEAWLAKLNQGRSPQDLMGMSREDDVPDPIGQPRPAYEQMVEELDMLIGDLVWLIWGEAERAEVAS